MTHRPTGRVLVAAMSLAALILLATAPSALADARDDALGFAGKLPEEVGINSMWVIIAGLLVMFMQAGFAMVEVGFARGKNAGSVIAKILVNFAIAGVAFWAVGFAFAFGDGASFLGTHGFFVGSDAGPNVLLSYPHVHQGVTVEALWFFEFAFCAVALAIVWGTTLERIKFGVYVIYGLIFGALIYPMVAHWIFGGGWLVSEFHVQDFAGAIVVDVTGAAAALAVLLLLGPRHGKYDVEGNSHAIPGHNMPLFGLGVLILWLGWFGFNPGSTLNALDGRFPTIVMITTIAGCFGVLAALWTMWLKTRTFDIGMAGNGAIAGLVAITGPAGFIEPWAAAIIGAIGGVIVVLGVLQIDKRLDDPVGVLAAHGLAGVWGALACGLFAAPRLAAHYLPGSHGGLFYTGSFTQLGSQVVGIVVVFVFVFAVSYATFWLIRRTYGLRVTAREEREGLDISEHGMYGYPEQFIPSAELVGFGGGPARSVPPAPFTEPK